MGNRERGSESGVVAAAVATGEASAEERLAQDRAILQYVVDHTPAWIFWKDRTSTYLGCNRYFARLSGRSEPAELVGLRDDDLAWSSQAEIYRAGDREVLDSGESVLAREETLVDGEGNEKVILTSKVPMRDARGEVIGVLGILFDITERKQTELEVDRAREAAEEAARARSQFIARMSHELRTPLTLILGPVAEALAQPDTPLQSRDLLRQVQRNGVRLLDLVNDVLDFSRNETGRVEPRPEPVDLAETARLLVDDMQPLAAANQLALSATCAETTLPALLDPRLVERILINLVGNALKFTPPGGLVEVEVRAVAPDEAELVVRDTGVGIPADALERVFEPFVQVDSTLARRFEGSGLGLAIVRQCVTAMGGTVDATSTLGEGTTFRVVLPRASGVAACPPVVERHWCRRLRPADAPPEPIDPRDVDTAPADRPRVLMVDDNPALCAFVADVLRPEFAVLTAQGGEDAWEQLQQRRFDVVVSDVMMPGVDGLELTRRIKTHPTLQQVPVLLVTARGGTDEIAGGLDDGADDYLAKPFAPIELRARVRSVIRTSRLQAELRSRSRLAGMVDVSASMLHHAGNVLNSVNVSAAAMSGQLRSSRVTGLARVLDLLARQPDPAAFLTTDDRGRDVLRYLLSLPPVLAAERASIDAELGRLGRGVDQLRTVLDAQRSFVRTGPPVRERVQLATLVADAIYLDAARADDPSVQVIAEVGAAGVVDTDPHKVLQILVELLANARDAVRHAAGAGVVRVRAGFHDGHARIEVEDDGVGIAPEQLARVFDPEYLDDHDGYGLHATACTAGEIGGHLSVHSAGAGLGATFRLVLPEPSASAEPAP